MLGVTAIQVRKIYAFSHVPLVQPIIYYRLQHVNHVKNKKIVSEMDQLDADTQRLP